MVDFILHFNTSQNKEKEDGEEDSKIENVNRNKQANINLLDLNDYKESIERCSVSRDSDSDSYSRNSQSIQVSERLETKEGWLLKRSYESPSVIGWQRRYCVLKNQKFLYYKSEDKIKLDGVIDFNLLTCLITVPKDLISEEITAGKVSLMNL